jgi:hypothetical protein
VVCVCVCARACACVRVCVYGLALSYLQQLEHKPHGIVRLSTVIGSKSSKNSRGRAVGVPELVKLCWFELKKIRELVTRPLDRVVDVRREGLERAVGHFRLWWVAL